MGSQELPAKVARYGETAFRAPNVGAEEQLFPVRILTREHHPDGAHIAFAGRADDEHFYFCKHDRAGVPCRMREVVFSKLAREVGISTPPFRVIDDEETGESYFGSQRQPSTFEETKRKRFLRQEKRDELGRYPDFPGRWLSQLHMFDLFCGNWDRSASNLVALQEGQGFRLCAIDFSAAELAECAIDEFPVASTETVQVAMQLKLVHGFFPDSAEQMLKRIEAVPVTVFKTFFQGIPVDWINAIERERLCDIWSGEELGRRIDALRLRLENGQVL